MKHNTRIRCVASLYVATAIVIGGISFKNSIDNKLSTLQNEINQKNQEIISLNDKISTQEQQQCACSNVLNAAMDGKHTIAYVGQFACTNYCGEPYPHICNDGLNFGYTFSGAKAESNKTISVDPTVIPLGSTVYIEGLGIRVAQDTGGAIKGNRIDIYYDTHQEAIDAGNSTRNVWIILNN